MAFASIWSIIVFAVAASLRAVSASSELSYSPPSGESLSFVPRTAAGIAVNGSRNAEAAPSTSTTTPPSVLFPPKPFLMLESSPQRVTVHRHRSPPIIKLPKIQIRKLYYSADTGRPMSLMEPRASVAYYERAHPKKEAAPRELPTEPRMFTRQSASHSAGYNPAVLESDESTEEGEPNEQPEQSPPELPPNHPHYHPPPESNAKFSIPQLPPSAASRQPIPHETMQQMMRPALSTEALDDELEQIHRQIISNYQASVSNPLDAYIKKMNAQAKEMAAHEPSFTLNFDPPAVSAALAPVPVAALPAPAPPRESVLTRIIDRMYRSPSTYTPEYVRAPAKVANGRFLSNIFNIGTSSSKPAPQLFYSSGLAEPGPIEHVHYIINERARPPSRLRQFFINRQIAQQPLLEGGPPGSERLVSQAMAAGDAPAYLPLPTIISQHPASAATQTHFFTLQDAIDSTAPGRYQRLNNRHYYRSNAYNHYRPTRPPIAYDHPGRLMTFGMASDFKPTHKAPESTSGESSSSTTAAPSTDSGKKPKKVVSYKTVEPLPNGSKVTVINSTSSQGPANLTTSSSNMYKITVNLPSTSKTVKVVKTTERLEPHQVLKHPIISELNKKLIKSKKLHAKKVPIDSPEEENTIQTETEEPPTARQTTYEPLIRDFLRTTMEASASAHAAPVHLDPEAVSARSLTENQTQIQAPRLHSAHLVPSTPLPMFIFN